jgi:bacterioferritin-associated ferredoxin
MIVCICNALREREIARSAETGATSPAQVFASLDCELRCGSCVPEIQVLLGRPGVTRGERNFECDRVPSSSSNSTRCSSTN